MFKSNGFLGFDFNKTIDDQGAIEPRKFKKLEAKFE
jgi:hypothetical protein